MRTSVQSKSPSLFNRSILEHRERLNAAKPTGQPAEVPYKDLLITVKEDSRIPIRVYRPKEIDAPYPTIFYIPGTAFVARELAFTDVICSHLAEKSQCQVIVINHRLAPEDQFPAGFNDAYSLFRSIINAPSSLFQIDMDKISLVGYSSGANFVASIVLRAKSEGISIAQQILISPMVDLSRSLKEFKKDFEDKDTVITEEFVEWFLDLYVPKNVDPKDPWLSPFWQESHYLKSMPVTHHIFGENDRFRSENEAYLSKLKEAGVSVHGLMVKKEGHAFLWNNAKILEVIAQRVKTGLALFSIPSDFANQVSLIKVRPLADTDTTAREEAPEATARRARL